MIKSSWKSLYIDNKILNSLKISKLIKSNSIFTLSRDTTIINAFVGFNFKVYNGFNFVDLNIKKNMIGYKLGAFIKTRKYPKFPKLKKK